MRNTEKDQLFYTTMDTVGSKIQISIVSALDRAILEFQKKGFNF